MPVRYLGKPVCMYLYTYTMYIIYTMHIYD